MTQCCSFVSGEKHVGGLQGKFSVGSFGEVCKGERMPTSFIQKEVTR